MTEILIDSNILIDISRKHHPTIVQTERLNEKFEFAISIITKMELIIGCSNKNQLKALQKFLNQFRVIKLNPAISETAVELLIQYRLSHGLLLPDSLIAATAIEQNIPLFTRNVKDFKYISELN